MKWSAITPDGSAGADDLRIVTVPSRAALLEAIESDLARGRGFTVATLNLDHIVKLRRDPAFRAAYRRHDHVTADGRPIVWLSRLAGHPVELAPGSELIEPVAELAARLKLPVAFFGASEATLEAAARELVRRHPGLEVVARIAPPMGFDPEGPEADAAIDAIGRSGARICFLALGAPRQEIFAVRASGKLPATGLLSIGAGLDFIAGTRTRAPAWVRAVAAEWLWRLGSEPRRLGRRYAACLAILPALAREAVRSRKETT